MDSGIQSLKKAGRPFQLLVLVLLLIAGTVTTFVLSRKEQKSLSLSAGQLSLEQMKDPDFREAVRRARQGERELLLAEASKMLRDQIHSVTDRKHRDYVPGDFSQVDSMIDFMLYIDPHNGHALYFRGEVYRLLKEEELFVAYFQRYLALEDSIGTKLPLVTIARQCYETAQGYCEKRTAWISQLLANYFYGKGITEQDPARKGEYLDAAAQQLHHVRLHFPDGFKASSVTRSTQEMEAGIGNLQNK
ncbi:MAG: hypothetical protein U0T82_16370 [Bacteroidales bacterium]